MNIDDLVQQFDGLMCVKKKKRPAIRIAVNDWIVQVIVDDIWETVYHATPPHGTPPQLHSVPDAMIIAGKRILERWEAQQEIWKTELNAK